MEVSVRELKNHLSEYLRRVQAGEEFEVTSRGRVVARLSVPELAEQPLSEEEVVERLRAQPWVIPARDPKGRIPAGEPAPARPGAPSSEEILDWVRG